MADTAVAIKRKHRARLEKTHFGYIFIAPFFLAYAFFSLYPLLSTFFYSITDKKLFIGGINLVGFDNFITVLGDVKFGQAFYHTPVMWIVGFVPQMALALLLSAWFTDAKIKIKAQGFFKVIFYLPNIMTAATIGGLFYAFIYKGGIIHESAIALGFITNPKMPLTGEWFGMGLVAFINFWMWFGNSMIILIAGVLGINPSLFEAAAIDGASSGQIFRKITIPLIRPIMTYTFVTSLIGGFQMFDIPTMLSPEGSAISQYIGTVVMYIKNVAFRGSTSVGVASAASIVLFAVTVLCSLIMFGIMKDRSEAKYQKRIKRLDKEKFGGVK